MVVAVDRGRWTCIPDSARPGDLDALVVAMRARELGRRGVVVGDQVAIVGDLSGAPGSLARIVRIEERTSVLLRTADDDENSVEGRQERVVVANAEQLVIVSALANPPPRTGFIDRCLVAAYDAEIDPLLCLTKADLADTQPTADPAVVAAGWHELDLPIVVTRFDRPPDEMREVLAGRVSALIGHSGVGKSTLVNALVPDAARAVGRVSGVGKGRHTSSSAVAIPLPGGGWVVDTPGVRSFGLAHVSATEVVSAFADLAAAITDCPRGCGHLGPPADPECALDALVASGGVSAGRLAALRRVLVALAAPSWS
jgi:ribosome biogenesis GTPase